MRRVRGSASTSTTARRFGRGARSSCARTFSQIARRADILIGNEEDFQLALGIEGPEVVEGPEREDRIFREMTGRVRAAYPQRADVRHDAARSRRRRTSTSWGAILFDQDRWYVAEPRRIRVLDRIGGGDAFVGGLLYGLLKGWSSEDCLRFGWATGAMAVTMLEDYASPADEGEVFRVWNGNARVQR